MRRHSEENYLFALLYRASPTRKMSLSNIMIYCNFCFMQEFFCYVEKWNCRQSQGVTNMSAIIITLNAHSQKRTELYPLLTFMIIW